MIKTFCYLFTAVSGYFHAKWEVKIRTGKEDDSLAWAAVGITGNPCSKEAGFWILDRSNQLEICRRELLLSITEVCKGQQDFFLNSERGDILKIEPVYK